MQFLAGEVLSSAAMLMHPAPAIRRYMRVAVDKSRDAGVPEPFESEVL